MEAHPKAVDLCGRAAITRGPLVYCAESIDNNWELRDVRILRNSGNTVKQETLCNTEVPVIHTKALVREIPEQLYLEEAVAKKEIPFKLIPYYTRANRGITEMSTWFLLED